MNNLTTQVDSMRVLHDGSMIKDRSDNELIKLLTYTQEDIDKYIKIVDWQKYEQFRSRVCELRYNKKQLIGELYDRSED